VREVELALGVEAPPQVLQARGVAIDQVEDEALEVGGFGDSLAVSCGRSIVRS
jgi:hypothetical protein